jgi:CO/xanthine dehydrogenase FAD-binding subunit
MEFYYPTTIKEAKEFLEKPSTTAVAGGTSFTGRNANSLVDLTRLGLDYIKNEKQEIRIGATTTITELKESKVLNGFAAGILPASCAVLADTQLRNVITIGGNIACRYLWANLPPALMALDAEVEITGRKKRTMSIEKFFGSKLAPGEFISEVIIPKGSNKGAGTFVRFARTKVDYPLISSAVYAEKQKNKISLLRVAVSGLTPSTRIRAIESELQGKKIDEKILKDAAIKAASRIRVLKSYVFSEEYLREVLGVLLTRALKKVLMEG